MEWGENVEKCEKDEKGEKEAEKEKEDTQKERVEEAEKVRAWTAPVVFSVFCIPRTWTNMTEAAAHDITHCLVLNVLVYV